MAPSLNPNQPTAHAYLDERQGRWTRILQEDSRVVVLPAPAHVRGQVARVVIVAAIACVFVRAVWQSGSIAAVIVAGTLSVTVVAFQAIRLIRRMAGLRQPVVTIYDREVRLDTDPRAGRVLRAEQIESLEICENIARDVSDMAMWQIYLRARNLEEPLLLHQRVKWKLEPEFELAAELARRWRVPLVDNAHRER